MKNAKILISQPTYNDGREVVSLTINCDDSRKQLIELEIGLADFTRCLGSREVSARVRNIVDKDDFQSLGKKKVIKQVSIRIPDDSWGYRPDREDIVAELDRSGYFPEWELWQDGRKTQQNMSGYHNVILCKYVEADK
jgi:hypothetical protein